ncbi:MAG: sialate O-acetylesterase [Niabella sp.]
MYNFRFIYLCCLLVVVTMTARAEVSLPNVLTDNMVLQQKTKASLWGKASPGKAVSIITSWDKVSYKAIADANGDWKVKVATPSYGGPYNITISEGNTIVLKNILIGEVWLCSGQSNMEMPLAGWGKVMNYQEEIAAADFPQIRLLQAIHTTSNQPVNEVPVRNNGWDICTPQTIADFSATAYFFARELYQKTKIPIGLIHSSWGGTVAEAWTSYEMLSTMPDFAAAAKLVSETPMRKGNDNLPELLKAWRQKALSKDIGFEEGKPLWTADNQNTDSWKLMNLPGLWEEKELPDFDGVVWFRKNVKVPANWTGKDVTLHFIADDEDVVFFNGQQIGTTNGYNVDRVYKIPASLIKEGENTLVIRVFDTGGGGGIYGSPNDFYLKNADGEKMSLSNSWSYKIGMNLKDIPPMPVSQDSPNRPTVLYNAMINPLINYTIRGAIWYQGESNADRAVQYRTLFPNMIKDWRNKFGIGDFPFYFVQLANFMKRAEEPESSNWAMLREAQLKTISLPNTGMATIIDVGDATDIHPKNKQEVGRRLALIALNKQYTKGNEYSGPLYKGYQIKGDKIILTFTHAKGLQAWGSDMLKGFAIAGADKKFHWASAQINGHTIVVSSLQVSSPVAVRYGWGNNPEVNLYNEEGLPASPFRTDDWEN